MSTSRSDSTSSSLLARVRRHEGDAWTRFADLYTPMIYTWARRCGLSDSDAADVVQEVCRRVICKIGSFGQGRDAGSFRGWLWVITRNQVRQHFRRNERQPLAQGGTDAAFHIEQLPEADDTAAERSAAADTLALVHRALRLIEDDFEDTTWQAFWRLAIKGESASEIAADLHMNPSAVRQAKYRVLCRLRQELEER